MKQEGIPLLLNPQGLFKSFRSVRLLAFLISFITVCICFLSLGAFNQTLATNYYVDSSITDTFPASATPDCNNYNTSTFTCSGGAQSAYKTIADINDGSFSSGDQILFRRGQTWHEQLNISSSGSAGNPIIFADFGSGALPVIHGGDILSPASWTGPDGNGVYQYTDAGDISIFSEDDIVLTYATSSTLSDGNWYMSGTGPTTIYYKPTSGTPSNHTTTISTNVACAYFVSANNSYVTIRNLNFLLCRLGVYGQATNGSLHDINIENSQFNHTAYGAIHLKGRNSHNLDIITISGNTLSNNCQSIHVGSYNSGTEKSTNILIENNKIYNGGLLVGNQSCSVINSYDREGIGLQNIANTTITGNEISGGVEQGAIVTWTNQSTVGTTGNQFTKNYIHNTLAWGISPGGDTENTSSSTTAYNIIENCGLGSSPPYGGLRLHQPQSPASYIYNNTISGCDMGIYLATNPDNYIIKNNLVSQSSGYLVYRVSTIDSNVLDYNLYYTDGSANFYYDGSDRNFAAWKSATSQDPHSLTSNPQFVAGGDAKPYPYFYPRSYSPVINAGTDVGLTKDYLNVNVPQGAAPEIGAFEYTVSIPENIWFFFPLLMALPRLIFLLSNRQGRMQLFNLISKREYKSLLIELYLPYLSIVSYLMKKYV